MVDISNHEDSLRELSKTSLVNNVTLVLCWSAAEAARYLELYKSYEHANFSAIQGHQANSYAEKLVEFVTVPRNVNKSDAVALVSMFGSLKNAVNADPEQIGVISGWGEKKVKAWCKVVDEPFRLKKAGKRRAERPDENSTASRPRLDDAVPLSRVPARSTTGTPSVSRGTADASQSDPSQGAQWSRNRQDRESGLEDDEDALLRSVVEQSKQTAQQNAARPGGAAGQKEPVPPRRTEDLSDGVAAALAKLREKG